MPVPHSGLSACGKDWLIVACMEPRQNISMWSPPQEILACQIGFESDGVPRLVVGVSEKRDVI